MDLKSTIMVFCISVIGFAFASWRAARPTQLGKVRFMPWLEISILLAVLAILMLVHFLSLFGLKNSANSPHLQ